MYKSSRAALGRIMDPERGGGGGSDDVTADLAHLLMKYIKIPPCLFLLDQNWRIKKNVFVRKSAGKEGCTVTVMIHRRKI